MAEGILGIDIGSVTTALVHLGRDGHIIQSAYDFHHGEIGQSLTRLLETFSLADILAVACTTSTPGHIAANARYDNQLCLMEAVRRRHGRVEAILNVGGEGFSLILYDAQGVYRTCRTNSACASGTGSFLDQQAARLDCGGIDRLSALASGNTGGIPRIATRCAVFAKTDLIHAQQEGYRLPEIAEGLCAGLARNIVDTVFPALNAPASLIFTGGVALNRAVARHLERLTGAVLVTDEDAPLMGALGAAWLLMADGLLSGAPLGLKAPRDLILPPQQGQEACHPPLELTLSDYPDFSAHARYEHRVTTRATPDMVEVDVYDEHLREGACEVYLGVDVGSTSTKAVLTDSEGKVVVGFYTRTAGRPVDAFGALCEAIEDFAASRGLDLTFRGAGTTGSGRALVGQILGADLILDEITAHARAACELDPRVDTIIEIGGQDAKFTTLSDGHVTFAAMNTVCAAGTGSFIEEQALKLGCPLKDCAARTAGQKAPITSDRCTVFMERDMNHHLSQGLSPDEVLASALHAVRENYLSKVAVESAIGQVVFFQGATAKNRSLVAAFEQRLERPILVSRYCHLTGAYGTALMLRDAGLRSSTFAGLERFRHAIPLRHEVCELCTNHCKLTVAEIQDRQVAYGFQCGRDYDTPRFVDGNTTGFDLMGERRRLSRACRGPHPAHSPRPATATVGIPAGLHLAEDLEFWCCFFEHLGIPTLTSHGLEEALESGRHIAGAEFCAPLAALHGHVHHLLQKADYVFVPYYLEDRERPRGVRRQHCYYTQFAPTLVTLAHPGEEDRILSPVVDQASSQARIVSGLRDTLAPLFAGRLSRRQVQRAWQSAEDFRRRSREGLQARYRECISERRDLDVVLLGRPYTVLDPALNGGIIDLFAAQGVRAFFQDMLPYGPGDVRTIQPLLDELHWKHAVKILEAAQVAALREGLYPVLVTSFRCAPDAFVADYFKQIMASYKKPYLILQLDGHDSSVGYATRIEAAVRSFRNHQASKSTPGALSCPDVIPARTTRDKTIVLPNWDHTCCRLVTAVLEREGFDVQLLEEDPVSMRKSLRYNTGQCIPLSILAQEYIDHIERHALDPASTLLWIGRAEIACNLKLIPHHIKGVLNAYGRGMQRAGVYHGDFAMLDISPRVSLNGYLAHLCGGMVRRLGCHIRPYEIEEGCTEEVLAHSLEILTQAFLGRRSRAGAVKEVAKLFEDIPVRPGSRPQAAIFGDIYVRDNDMVNQGLVRYIENLGGEVVTTPYTDYMKMIAPPYFHKWIKEGKYTFALSTRAMLAVLERLERRYLRPFLRVLGEPPHPYDDDASSILARYAMIPEHTGESMDNILKTHYLKKYYPDIALFVQASPAFCCPALVTEAMSPHIERLTGVPVVNITYDGTLSPKNTKVIPYLRYPRNRPADETLVAILEAARG